MSPAARRQLRPELMDDPALDERAHRHALRGLARINALSRADAAIWRALEPLLAERPLRLLDVATGSADVPIRLAARAGARSLDLTVAACDASPVAVDAARRRAADTGTDMQIFEHDALTTPLPRGYDVVTCSLFLHHLSDEQAARLLREMADAAAHAVVVSDLRRTTHGLVLAALAGRLLTRSPVVHVDAVLSARAALTIAELARIAGDAGLENADIRPGWPSRMRLTWKRPDRP